MVAEAYSSYSEYYADLFRKLDLTIFLALGVTHWTEEELHKQPYKGLVMSEQEVYELLENEQDQQMGQDLQDLYEELMALEALIEARLAESRKRGVWIPLDKLKERFGLTNLERDALFICLAPEIKRKYEKIYAYLQDDMTCKYATADVMFQLICHTAESAHELRGALANDSLLSTYIFVPSDHTSSLISKPLRMKERIVQFVLNQQPYHRIGAQYELYKPEQDVPELLLDHGIHKQIVMAENNEAAQKDKRKAVYVISGPSGSGKLLHVRHTSKVLQKHLIVVDLKELPQNEDDWSTLMDDIVTEALLQQAILCFHHCDALLKDQEQQRRLSLFIQKLSIYQGPLFLLSTEDVKPLNWPHREWIPITLSVPDAATRTQLWSTISRDWFVQKKMDWGSLGSMFRFTPGQMKDALRYAELQLRWKGKSGQPIGTEELYEACYAQVSSRMSDKATRITPQASWSQLILPDEQKQLLRNACDQMRYRHIVYSKWGFDRRLSYGKGLSMLFSGPPGTGKTMAAEVVAQELHMEIYKIDLSQIISKYIGETEKNLREIFEQARDSHAILFFDESDALLGKRSEVKDAHDKYANVEVAYLLQKVEEYDGISVMATNYLQNIDEAFMRRISYVIHFPFPDEGSRERIWRGMFPEDTPIDEDVNFSYIARKFQLTGGSIKNAAVAAAFLAAREQSAVQMKHILQSLKQELMKQGKIILKEDLREFEIFY